MWEAFSDGPVVKNPPCNAGDTSSICGKIPPAMGQLRPRTLEPVLRNIRSHHSENLCPATEASSLHSPRLEKAHMQQQRPSAAKIYIF